MTLAFHTALSEMFDKLVARSWVNVAIPHSRGGNELTKFTFSGLGLNIQSSPVTYTHSTHKNLCVADSKRDFFVINRAMHGRGRVDWVMSDRGFKSELRAMSDRVSRANFGLFINQVLSIESAAKPILINRIRTNVRAVIPDGRREEGRIQV